MVQKFILITKDFWGQDDDVNDLIISWIIRLNHRLFIKLSPIKMSLHWQISIINSIFPVMSLFYTFSTLNI